MNMCYTAFHSCKKIGAALIYEDIEANFQLQYAWRNGGRYFQGFYLHEPAAQLIDRNKRKEQLKEEFQQFIAHEKKKLQAVYEHSETFISEFIKPSVR